jgi:hypothetical protein
MADSAADLKRKSADVRHRHEVSDLLPHVPDGRPCRITRPTVRANRKGLRLHGSSCRDDGPPSGRSRTGPCARPLVLKQG